MYTKIAPCGCAVDKHNSIHYCPMHKTAPMMYEALKGMLGWAKKVKELNPGMEVFNAMQAIAKAEGK